VANPTATQLPTDTPSPTATATATATITPSPSPTPDLRLIDLDPRKLLLQKTDLPPEGKYFLPNELWTSPLTNAEIVAEWTVEEGQAYLAETGRIDGWSIDYKRGTNGVIMPEEIHDNVVIYSSVEGAQIVITKYDNRTVTESNFIEIDVPKVGDITRAFKWQETNSGGATRVAIKIAFTYRNVYHYVQVWGWEKEVSLDFAIRTATKLVEGLKQLPLSDAVTFTP